MPRSTRGVALRAAAFIALTALLARASPAPLDCCGDGSCALECTEGCAAAECAACCDPCAGVVCPAPTAQCKVAGTCSGAGLCSAETTAPDTTVCDDTATGDGLCAAGACISACAGVVCPPPTAQCKVAGTCSGAGVCADPDAAAGAACDYTPSAADGMCDGAGACEPAAPVGSWAAVSQGGSWGCGVDAAQRAWCWGTSVYGALGQGLLVGPGRRLVLYTAQTQLQLPALVVSAPLFASITAGEDHACALTPTGAAYCWGLNAAGQLGDGTQVNAGVPMAVSTSGTPAAWAKISAGYDHTCAISADAARQPGSVWCWGNNDGGKLGVAVATASSPVPVQTTGVAAAADVSAGDTFSCALAGAGVLCWGKNDFGQLGSAGSDSNPHPTPQPVAGVAGAAGVSAGYSAACAWAVGGGSAWCWGDDYNGQLGNGGSDDTASGAVLVATPGGVAWTQVAAHNAQACGLSAAGGAYCWGASAYVGGGPPPLDTSVPVPVAAPAPGPLAWASLSTGCMASTTVAVAAGDASAYGWGLIDRYVLGNGVAAAPYTSTLFPIRAGVPPCAGVACAGAQTCDADTGFCA